MGEAKGSAGGKMRRWLIIGLLLSLVVVVGLWLFNYLSTGNLVVSTPSTNSKFTITDSNGKEISSANGERFSTRLKAGSYSVEANHDNGATRQSFTITARQTTVLELEVIPLREAVLVANRVAEDLHFAGNTLLFRDPTINRLIASTGEGVLQPYTEEINIVNVKWLDGTKGVIQNLSNNAFLLENESIADVSNIADVETPSIVGAIATDAANNQFAYAEYTDVYLSQQVGVSKNVHTAEAAPSLALSANKLAIYFHPADGEEESIRVIRPYILNLDTNEKIIFDDEEVITAVWSPDGSQLAYETNTSIKIFDYASQRVIRYLPRDTGFDAGVPMLWINKSEFLFVDSEGMWRLKPESNQVVKLAELKSLGGSAGLGLTMRADTGEVFFSNGDLINPAIYKISLNGSYNKDELALSSLLPHVSTDYEISMLNITNPILTITTYAPVLDISKDEYEERTEQIKSSALDFISQGGLDPNSLSVRYVRGNPNYR